MHQPVYLPITDFQHPLQVGTKVRIDFTSYDNDPETEPEDAVLFKNTTWCEEEGEAHRHVFPGDVARIVSVDHYPHQGWTYGLVFDNFCWIFIDQSEGDRAQFEIVTNDTSRDPT